MGRDTGIIIRGNVDIPFYVHISDVWKSQTTGYVQTEICYWRGDYTMVNQMRKLLNLDSDDAEIELSAEDVVGLAEIVRPYWANKRRITNDRYSRWDLFRDYLNLKWLSRLLSKRPIEVIFYDSF